MTAAVIDPDPTDWVAVSWDGCEQCGFEPVGPDRIPGRIRETIIPWREALRRPGADRRPAPTVWSTLEYGCHVRDICDAFTDRLARVLAVDGATCPEFDATTASVEGRYAEQDPNEVAEELGLRIELIAQRFIGVAPLDWGRRGRRSDGPAFTPASMSNHFLHELEHHLHDVTAPGQSQA